MKQALVIVSLACSGSVAGYFSWAWMSGKRQVFLPGTTTHGHYQIELECETCHEPWSGSTQAACERCHGEELEVADDSHPKSKFTDPRNAARVAKLDARKCTTCHTEHRPELTGNMGLTQPRDYCFHCHSDIASERPSHEGLGFETCESAGCHNFHDNRGLHEDYLEKHLEEPATLVNAVAVAGGLSNPVDGGASLSAEDQDAPVELRDAGEIAEWEQSAHARAGVNCSGCHRVEGEWLSAPTHDVCAECHEKPVAGFLAGKHGMRLSLGLSPMKPALARAPMHAKMGEDELGCGSCHGSHRYDVQEAATARCLDCHADEHSRAYEQSSHAALARAERSGQGPAGSGVTCATCHLPRQESRHPEREYDVQHNQNDNLRPNEKMLRSVCAACHGVAFAMDALADSELIERNFDGRPRKHVRSVDMVRHKLQSIEASRVP